MALTILILYPQPILIIVYINFMSFTLNSSRLRGNLQALYHFNSIYFGGIPGPTVASLNHTSV